MKKKSIPICGTKTTTLPTPAMTPSTIRSLRMPGGSAVVTPVCNHPVAVSIPVINGADQVNNASKRTAITTANATSP